MAIVTSPRFRPTWVVIWQSAGPPTTSNCDISPSRPLRIATTAPAASQPGTGRRKCTRPPSRSRASSPRRLRKQRGAARALRGMPSRAKNSAGSRLLRDVEVELDQHVVRIGHENLPARAVRPLVGAKRHAFAREMLLHGLEAAAAEGDVVDDA